MDDLRLIRDIATSDVIFTTPEESLSTVIFKFARKNLASIPVLDGAEQDRFLGMLRHKDVLDFYRERLDELYEASETTTQGPGAEE